MKLYTADEIRTEDDEIIYNKKILALETKQEEEAYRNKLFYSLTAPFDLSEEDICYCTMPGDRVEDVDKGATGLHLEREFHFEEDEPIVNLDDGFAVDLDMTLYLPSDGYCEATDQSLYAQSEKSAKTLAEGVLHSVLEESGLQVGLSAKSARTFRYDELSNREKPTVSEEKRVAEYIKSNNLDIRWILEEMGYFQHILAGEDFVKSRLEALYECCDINIPYGIDREAFFKRVTDHVIKNNGFDAMNEKTESMEEADENLVDNAIEESAKAVQQEMLNESREKESKNRKQSL